MSNLKSNFFVLCFGRLSNRKGGGEPVNVVDGEIRLISRFRVVTVGDVEDVVGDVFFDDEPGTAGEAHAFALTDGMEPETTMRTDTTTSFEFDDITGVFTEVTSDIVIVIDLTHSAI